MAGRGVLALSLFLCSHRTAAQLPPDSITGSNITIATWSTPTECQGLPDKVESTLPGQCIPLAPLMASGQKTWVRAQCQEVTGFFWDVQVEVVLRQYGDKDCTTTTGQGPPVTTQPDTCFEVRENENNEFIEDITFSCEGVPRPQQPDDDSWPVPGMSLMAAAVLCVCLFGQCQAQARARRYRPRVSTAQRRHRESQRGSLLDGMYDPSEHVGYGSHRETERQTERERDRARETEVVNELSPAAKELVREHEQSGSEAPTMQQITQMVLRAKSVPPSEKRHTMMTLFRHWGYAGGEKPPASDHPATPRETGTRGHSETDRETETESMEQSVDVEAPAERETEGDTETTVEAGSAELAPLLLQGAE